MSSRVFTTVYFAGVLLILTSSHAHAYLDPGSGSYITQIVLAFFLGGLYLLKTNWNRVKTFLRQLFKSK